MFWAILILSLFSVGDCISMGKIQDNIMIGIINNSLSNITEDQCICQMVKSNGLIAALNYFQTNQTRQLFSYNISSVLIQFNFNSSFIFTNQSSISIKTIQSSNMLTSTTNLIETSSSTTSSSTSVASTTSSSSSSSSSSSTTSSTTTSTPSTTSSSSTTTTSTSSSSSTTTKSTTSSSSSSSTSSSTTSSSSSSTTTTSTSSSSSSTTKSTTSSSSSSSTSSSTTSSSSSSTTTTSTSSSSSSTTKSTTSSSSSSSTSSSTTSSSSSSTTTTSTSSSSSSTTKSTTSSSSSSSTSSSTTSSSSSSTTSSSTTSSSSSSTTTTSTSSSSSSTTKSTTSSSSSSSTSSSTTSSSSSSTTTTSTSSSSSSTTKSTTSSSSSSSTSSSTTSSSSSSSTSSSTTSSSSTSSTTSTTTTTSGCSASGTTTHAPGGQGGESVIYTFDQTTNDYYGNYNAVPFNNPQYISPGYNGRGYAIQLLSTQSQYLTIANYMNFYRTSLTVEAWIYPLAVYIGNPYADMIIYAQTNSSQLYQYMWMMLRNGKVYGAFYADDSWGATVFQANQWQHIAFTYNYTTTTQVVYINGVADATNPNAPPCLITAGVQTIGTYPGYNGGFFDGYIDQLEILFDRAKTAAEILDDATLVGYYSMDCLSYPAWDSGPNQITGVAVGLVSGDGGRLAQSYLFNTSLSYFQVTGLVLLGQSYSPFSFAMWLRPITSVTSGGTILHVSQNADGTGWCFQFIGLSSLGEIVVRGYNASGSVQITGPVLIVGQWVHIVEIYSQLHGIRLYVNGILYGQSSAFVYAASGMPMIVTLGQPLNGGNFDHGRIQSGYYRGEIDEFYIYSRELSQSDITSLANP